MRRPETLLREYLAERTAIVVMIADAAGVVRKANATARRELGAQPGAALRSLLLNPDRVPDPVTLAAEEATGIRLAFPTASGMPATYLCTFARCTGGMLVVAEPEYGELDRLRRDLLAVNQEIGAQARELARANAELRRLDEEKNRLLGIAAHDLRNPLAAIAGFAELLEPAGEDAAQQAEAIGQIRGQCAYMLRLLSDLLDLSAVEAAILRLEPEEFDLRLLLREVEATMQLAARRKRIALRVAEPADALVMRGDRYRLRQALENLVSNAVKFSPSDTTVVVSVREFGDRVELLVKDRGQGLEADELSRIFEPFVRGRARPTGGEKGTGLGLAITRKIAHAHGGDIQVESSPGHGSTFRIILPRDGMSREKERTHDD